MKTGIVCIEAREPGPGRETQDPHVWSTARAGTRDDLIAAVAIHITAAARGQRVGVGGGVVAGARIGDAGGGADRGGVGQRARGAWRNRAAGREVTEPPGVAVVTPSVFVIARSAEASSF